MWLQLLPHDCNSFDCQVIALCAAPFLLENPKLLEAFPKDAVDRARTLLKSLSGGVGAYQDSRGNPLVRQEVAKFIEERDGYPANPDVSSLCPMGAGVGGGAAHSKYATWMV